MSGILTRNAYGWLWAVWLAVAAGVFLLCMCVGPGDPGTNSIHVSWPPADVWQLRLMRVLPAAMVGFALAGAGVALQALLRNPLADPYVLGISSGSSVGVLLWLLLAGPLYSAFSQSETIRVALKLGAMGPAILGAVLTCVVVFLLARSRRGSGIDSLTLLLVGVVVSAVNAAILLLLNHLAPPEVRLNLQTYMMGTISNDVTPPLLALAAIVLLLGYVPVLLMSPALNIGSLTEIEAVSLGVNVSLLRRLCFLSGSVMTGASIMLAGPIGFVGLICPHICRRIVGADHRKLTVAAPLAGAAFLMIADTFVNATGGIFRGELPVGVITALCGGPFFLFLLKRRSAEGAAE